MVACAGYDQYCGSACQKADWLRHKIDCKSTLMKEEWEPKWVVDGRKPAFISNEAMITFGGKKYFWGNMPAIDVVQLDKNEGAHYQEDLRLLFAG